VRFFGEAAHGGSHPFIHRAVQLPSVAEYGIDDAQGVRKRVKHLLHKLRLHRIGEETAEYGVELRPRRAQMAEDGGRLRR
jgi:hypothetical protein